MITCKFESSFTHILLFILTAIFMPILLHFCIEHVAVGLNSEVNIIVFGDYLANCKVALIALFCSKQM